MHSTEFLLEYMECTAIADEVTVTMEASAEDMPTQQRWSVSLHELGRYLGVWPKNPTRCMPRAQHRLTNRITLCRGALAPTRGRRKQGSAHCPQESAHGCCHYPGPPRLILASETRDQAVSVGTGSADVPRPCPFVDIKRSNLTVFHLRGSLCSPSFIWIPTSRFERTR